jgi:hypothetical protein
MKKVFIPTVIILITAFYFGCKKKKTNVEFDVQYTTDIIVPTYSVAQETYSFVTNDILTNMSSQLSNNNTTADLVGEVKCTKFDVSVKTPTTGSVDFIKQMRFYINATNLPEQQVAYKYNDTNDTIMPGAKTTSFKLNDPNLKNRYMLPSFYYKIKLMTAYNPGSTTITVTHNVHVKAITQ